MRHREKSGILMLDFATLMGGVSELANLLANLMGPVRGYRIRMPSRIRPRAAQPTGIWPG
jgi:hypothetical protein